MGGRPQGISIVAIVLAVGGVFSFLVGTEALGLTKLGPGAAADAAGIGGSASVVSGVITILAAGGLFTLSGWAWLLAVAVLVLRNVVDLIAIATHGLGSGLGSVAIGNVVVSVVILWYFMRPSVKRSLGR